MFGSHLGLAQAYSACLSCAVRCGFAEFLYCSAAPALKLGSAPCRRIKALADSTTGWLAPLARLTYFACPLQPRGAHADTPPADLHSA